ncbi:hypothetical protein F5050DRAFT_1553873, partial [Lentinula boryana]
LKARHKKAGPVKQVLLIQEALGIRYSRTETFSSTSSKISELNTRIWAMGTPSEELFLCILMINTMTSIPELETTQGLVAQDLAKSQPDSTGKTTYKSSDINVALDTAQTLVNADGKTTDLVFAAQGSCPPKQPFKPSHRPQCTNPQCSQPSGHQIEYCVSPGGGMAGKTI